MLRVYLAGVASLDNPAGRLHRLLSNLAAHLGANDPILPAWETVLGPEVGSTEQRLALARVAGLVPAIFDTLRRADLDEQLPIAEFHAVAWLQPIQLWDEPTNKTPRVTSGLIDIGALHALGLLAELLSVRAPEGVDPPQGVVLELRDEVANLREAILKAADLPDGLRRFLLGHLQDIARSLEEFYLSGPRGVAGAVEHFLAQSQQLQDQPASEGPAAAALRRTQDLAVRVYIVFTALPTMQAALESAGWFIKHAQALPGVGQ